jgi:SAM-dependent methyltransferase
VIRRMCCVCDADAWLPLPDPAANRSITTGGILLDEPLSKGQCASCGLISRVGATFVGESNFYEERYASYYRRPGAQSYDAARYAAMVGWMCGPLAGLEPKSILDVGCGAGWSMLALRKRFPGSVIEGIEPSKVNAELARQAGFEVRVAKVGDSQLPRKNYDLIYAHNVLQHVLSPVAFLTELRGCLSPSGLLALICPDASRPNNEMLWCDHNYSFIPRHLARLAEKTGLHVRSWSPNPSDVTVLDKQLVVLAPGALSDAPLDIPNPSPDELYRERRGYVQAWHEVHRSLREETKERPRTFNFGASTWTWLLAAYCPDYWRRVDCCVVDGFSGECVDKAVKRVADVALRPGDALVLGVNPVSQEAFARKFPNAGAAIVRWDHYVRA